MICLDDCLEKQNGLVIFWFAQNVGILPTYVLHVGMSVFILKQITHCAFIIMITIILIILALSGTYFSHPIS